MTCILYASIVHKTASQGDEGSSAYCQSSGAHNIKHNLWKLTLKGCIRPQFEIHLNYPNNFPSKKKKSSLLHDLTLVILIFTNGT